MRKFAAFALPMLAALACAAPAHADTATVSFLDASGRDDPVVGVGRAFIVSGNSPTPKRLYVRYRPAGGAPCAPSASSDSGLAAWDSSDYSGDTFNDSQVNGNFKFTKTGVWRSSGTYTFCMWLASSVSSVATPIRQDITFRAPVGVVSGSIAPVSPLVGQAATVTITGSSEASKQVFATYKLAGGSPCAVSYRADSGIGLLDGRSVNGAFSLTATLTPREGGNYMLCFWLADSSSDSAPVAGPQQATFTVPSPCVVPSLTDGMTVSAVQSLLVAAHCTLGAQTQEISTTVRRGSVIRLGADSGDQLAPDAAVPIVVSTGKPCIVPASPKGLSLSRARSRLQVAGCTAGKVSKVRSSRRKGTVVSFSPKAGKSLASLAVVNIRVSRGRH